MVLQKFQRVEVDCGRTIETYVDLVGRRTVPHQIGPSIRRRSTFLFPFSSPDAILRYLFKILFVSYIPRGLTKPLHDLSECQIFKTSYTVVLLKCITKKTFLATRSPAVIATPPRHASSLRS